MVVEARTRVCTTCHKRKPISQFYWIWRNVRRYPWCRTCYKKRQAKYQGRYKRVRDQKTYYRKIRADAIKAYGGKCVCCGEDHYEFMAFDHIHRDGHAHRKNVSVKSMVLWLKRNGYPKGDIQLLCHNCNVAKAYYGRCPHTVKKAKR